MDYSCTKAPWGEDSAQKSRRCSLAAAAAGAFQECFWGLCSGEAGATMAFHIPVPAAPGAVFAHRRVLARMWTVRMVHGR